MFDLTEKEVSLMKACGSGNEREAVAAQAELTKAIAEEFYKEGTLDGDLTKKIFIGTTFDEDVAAEYILDLVVPGTEREYIAWYMPETGYIPERIVNMNKVIVPTKSVSNSVNCPLKFLRQKRVDILSRMLEVLEAGFIMRDNLEAFTVILTAGSANTAVDASVTDGVFDFASLRAMKLDLRRRGGGNSTSVSRYKMTDLFLGPEAAEDIRELVHDVADDFSRRKIAEASDLDGFHWQGVDFNVIDELGDGQLFQDVWTETLAQAMLSSTEELLIGLDLSPKGKRCFVNPKRRGFEMFEDAHLHRRQEFGWYAWKERGWGVLTDKPIVIGNA